MTEQETNQTERPDPEVKPAPLRRRFSAKEKLRIRGGEKGFRATYFLPLDGGGEEGVWRFKPTIVIPNKVRNLWSLESLKPLMGLRTLRD
jgi:hypothetical protein